MNEFLKKITEPTDDPQIISYQHMRKAVGYLAFFLPVIVCFGYMAVTQRWLILDSISEYYFTVMRSFFVATLSMVAMFLYAYKGYTILETWVFKLAALLCILVALFSMNPQPICSVHSSDSNTISNIRSSDCDTTIGDAPCIVSNNFSFEFKDKVLILHRSYFSEIHLFSAGLLFILLGLVSFHFFPMSKGIMTKRKRKRNILYRTCGIAIWVLLAFYEVWDLLIVPHNPSLICIPMLLIVETLNLWAFGISWFVKGEGIAPLNDTKQDKEQQSKLGSDMF